MLIENDVVLGDRVTVKCGVQLWDGLRVGDDVFIGRNATFSHGRPPHSRPDQRPACATHIAAGALIGAKATILPGLHIGSLALVRRERRDAQTFRPRRSWPAIRPAFAAM